MPPAQIHRPAFRAAALFATALLHLPAARAGDTLWGIHLDRPCAIGDRTSHSSHGTQDRHTITTAPPQPRESSTEHMEVTYTAIHEVLEITPAGRPRTLLLRIDRLTTDDGSGPQEQFKPGTLVTATVDGDRTIYRLGREELDGTLSDALDLAGAKLPSLREPSEDAVFLNHIPRKPGEKWDADAKRLADAIEATSPFIIDPITSSAHIRFDGPVVENAIPALATTATFSISPGSFRNNPAARLTGSLLTSTTERIHPIDPALPLLKESIDTSMKLVQRTIAGPQPTNTETTFKRQTVHHILPLPAKGKQP